MIRRRRTLVVALAVMLVLVAVALPLGRREGSAAVRSEQQEIEATLRRTPAGIGWQGLAAFRLTPTFDCLLYRVGKNPFALEFCFDGDGRLIEAIDRRNPTSPHFGSLRYDPDASPVRIAPTRLARFFRHIVGLEHVPMQAGPPLGFPDGGPALYRFHCPRCPATG